MNSLEEQETVISFGRLDNECEVYTTDRTVMTKLEKRVANGDWEVKEVIKEDGEVVGKIYKGNKKLVRFVTRKVKRELTDEQRQALRERMQKAQASRKRS